MYWCDGKLKGMFPVEVPLQTGCWQLTGPKEAKSRTICPWNFHTWRSYSLYKRIIKQSKINILLYAGDNARKAGFIHELKLKLRKLDSGVQDCERGDPNGLRNSSATIEAGELALCWWNWGIYRNLLNFAPWIHEFRTNLYQTDF